LQARGFAHSRRSGRGSFIIRSMMPM
jgi:hypothetical protein